MKFNSRVDLVTEKILDLDYFDTKLNHLRDDLYVTFVATKEGNTTDAWKDQYGTHLFLVLPYEEVVTSNNVIGLMKTYLLETLPTLDWLDYRSLKEDVARVLESPN